MTEAICSGAAGEGHAHRELCQALVNKMGNFQFIYGVGTRAPLCEKVCFHSCDGNHVGGQDHDSFQNCKQAECATTPCLDFFLAECPPVMHEEIRRKYEGVCTLAAPSPPSPPSPPPSPPLPPHPPPHAPPPTLKYVERFRDTELGSDPDCELVSHATCLAVIQQFARLNPGYSSEMRVTTSSCDELDVETDCFIGCAFGSKSGGTYRFLALGAGGNDFTKPRCSLSIHPRCACANHAPPPPFAFPPPPPGRFTEDWNPVQIPLFDKEGRVRDTSRGVVGAMHQRLVNGKTMDLSLRSGPMHAFQCPLEDDGADTCALTCANEHLSRLKAFTVRTTPLYTADYI